MMVMKGSTGLYETEYKINITSDKTLKTIANDIFLIVSRKKPIE